MPTPELAIIFRGESVSGHPGARGGPKVFENRPETFRFLFFPPTVAQPTWGSNLVRESAQGPDRGRIPHKFETFGGPVAGARWPGGPVARWPGGLVARWPVPIGRSVVKQRINESESVDRCVMTR